MQLAGNPQDVVVPPVEGVAGGGTAYGWNDGGTHGLNVKGPIDPTGIPTRDLVHVWCMPSTANVGPQDMPRHLEPVSTFVVSHCGGLYSYSSSSNLMVFIFIICNTQCVHNYMFSVSMTLPVFVLCCLRIVTAARVIFEMFFISQFVTCDIYL